MDTDTATSVRPGGSSAGVALWPAGRKLAAFALILALGMACRFYAAWCFGPSWSSDHGIACLMARHVALGRELPVFYYGQPYMGSLEMIAGGAIARVLGINETTLNLGTALFGILLLPLVYLWGRKATDVNGGLAAMLLCAVGSRHFLQFMSWSFGAYACNAFFSAVLVLLAVRLAAPGRRGAAWLWLLAGFIAGLGWWSNQLIVPACIAAAAVFFAGGGRIVRALRGAVPAVAGFAAGSFPFWAWNTANGWETFQELGVRRGWNVFAQNTGSFSLRFLPEVLGLPGGRAGWIPFAVLSVFTAWAVRTAWKGGRGPAAACRLAVPLLAVFSIVVFSMSCHPKAATTRHLLALVPAAAVVGGAATSWLVRKAPLLGWLPACAAVVWQLTALPQYALEIRPKYIAHRDAGARLADSLQESGAGVVAAPYVRMHALNWLLGERVVFSDYKESYPPNADALERATRLVAVENPEGLIGFMRQTGGEFAARDVAGFTVCDGIMPPPRLAEAAAGAVVSAVAEGGEGGWAEITDGREDTAWVFNAPAELTVRLARTGNVAMVRLFSASRQYPSRVEVLAAAGDGGEWGGVGAGAASPWFWSGSRPYCGRLFQRMEVRVSAPPDADRLKIRFSAGERAPAVIAELQLLEEADATPGGMGDCGPEELAAVLRRGGAARVYADRWLANELAGRMDGAWCSRRPDLYGPRPLRRAVALSFAPAEGIALVADAAQAGLTRRTLLAAGVSAEEERAGPWTVFSLTGGAGEAELVWAGFGCLMRGAPVSGP